MQAVVDTPVFVRRAEKLLSGDEHHELITFLATHPAVGDEIVGTGGVEKSGLAPKEKGSPAVYE